MSVAQISWILVGAGVALVLIPVVLLARRRRPLTKALRRLHWRRSEVEQLRAMAEGLRERIDDLMVELPPVPDREVRRSAQGQDPAYDGPVRRGL